MVHTQAPKEIWDEPKGATTPRGWYWPPGTTKRDVTSCAGHYLDYGADHKRYDAAQSMHPGHIHCVVLHAANSRVVEWTYVETAAQARQWVEKTAEKYGHR